jgi:toxin ParE1/3/4
MNRYSISPRAKDDLQAIWNFIGIEQDSPDAAQRLLQRFCEKFILLATQPLLGQLREDLRPGLRLFVADNYVILYYPTNDGIDVAGVVHAARHIEWLFQSGER